MKLKYILISFLAGSALVSCNDYLDVKSESQYTDEIVFKNVPLAEDAVISIYSYFAATNSHRARYMPYYGMNTDAECYFDLAQPTSDTKTSLCTYSAFSANNWMASGKDPNAFSCFFNGIEAANCCIEGIRNNGDPANNAEMAYLLGEALALRAQFYYDLIRAWGDVPARFEPVGKETVYSPKSDRDVIYKQIIADLKEAAGYLPWPGKAERTKTVERVNKAYALGLRARLILMAEGYSQRPTSLDNPTSYEVRRSNDPALTSTELLQEAYTDLKDVIANGDLELDNKYEDFWNDLATDVIDFGGSHRESIFEIPFNDGRGRFFYHFGVYHFTSSPHLKGKKDYGGQNIPVPTLYYEYDNGDLRRDVNCVPYKYSGDGYTLENLGENAAAPGFNFGKYDYERMTRVVTANDDGVNLPVIRYADVLLMAAELANELEGPESAKPYLKKVRNRAFAEADRPAHVEAYVNALSSKDAMLKAIQKERLLEFPGEMLRKQDLIRWNILGSTVKSTVEKMKQLKNREGEYANVPTEVYYRMVNGKLEYYGLAKGETAAPTGQGWTKLNYDFVTTAVKDNMLLNYYANDPDSRQYWPIFDSDISSSNGALINNYGY